MNVRFPGLGLEFELSRWPFKIFGFPIYWYGILISLAFLTAVLLALGSSKKYRIEPDTILDMVLIAAPVAIVFARIYYVIFSWDQYKDNLIDVFKIRDGGLAIYGAVIGALLAAWLYTRKKKISFLQIADFCVPYLVLGQAIGRWGNFVNQEAFGTKTDLPWRMNGTEPDKYLNSLPEAVDISKFGVHPTFLYESLLDLAIFFFLIYFRKKKKLDGEVLSLYFVLYGAGRFMIEGLRTDSLWLGPFRVSQLLSAILVIVFVPLFIYRRARKSREVENEQVVLGQSSYGSLLMQMKEQEQEEQAQEEQAQEGQVQEEQARGELGDTGPEGQQVQEEGGQLVRQDHGDASEKEYQER
ncbi:MAG: prolipoprotein diacylglyceryl transferase [Acetivibrionales bacterium]|jgi:phosphatidylglycerol:prolipoprotein diacylglycerol transferase